MGRGVSVKEAYNIQYKGLKKVQRELLSAGVPTTYKDRELRPVGYPSNPAFQVHYTKLGPASNGETAFLLVIRIGKEVYGGTKWNSTEGLNRLKNEFKSPPSPAS